MAFAVPVPMNDRSSNSHNSSFTTHWGPTTTTTTTADGHADDATIDGYAMRVLENASPPDISVDADYLGPYITGVLRSEPAVSNVEQLDEYDNILELLQEHCTMSRRDAQLALEKIARAVRTGTVPAAAQPAFPVSSPGPFGSSPPSSGGFNALQLLETVNVEEAVAEVPTVVPVLQLQIETDRMHKPSVASVISPVKPDNLIPIDLLGAIDAEEETNDHDKGMGVVAPIASNNTATTQESLELEDEFPSLAVAAKQVTKKQSRASRSRQGSIDESSLRSDQSSSRKVSPNLQPTTPVLQQPYFYNLDGHETDPATMLQLACDLLTQMNPDMGADAIFQACAMANANVGVAQYLMDCAMTAPPVCRHLLHAGCYRSDCQFSHDLEGHTCVFWLRGHCNKGTACQFLHGYKDQWLLQLEEQQAQQYSDYTTTSSHYQEESSSWELQQQQQQQPLTTSTNSFANIASQGYNNRTCFQQQQQSNNGPYYEETTKFASPIASIKIPQDVWNPHERRDASAFHIADPMERYREVSRHTSRTDVIDLHFQSTKTFATVLGQVLPEKLAATSGSGLWVVTGTGHHVGSKTHQKGGGILESAVLNWLSEEGYEFWKGKDRNGHGGAVFVKNHTSSESIQQ